MVTNGDPQYNCACDQLRTHRLGSGSRKASFRHILLRQIQAVHLYHIGHKRLSTGILQCAGHVGLVHLKRRIPRCSTPIVFPAENCSYFSSDLIEGVQKPSKKSKEARKLSATDPLKQRANILWAASQTASGKLLPRMPRLLLRTKAWMSISRTNSLTRLSHTENISCQAVFPETPTVFVQHMRHWFGFVRK